MKIGILTFYYNNFGSYFQAMALQDLLMKQGYDVDIIHTSVMGVKKCITYFGGIVAERILPRKICNMLAKKYTSLDVYMSLKEDMGKIKTSRVCIDIKKLSGEYDCMIIGGDTLWCVEECGYYPFYFGQNIMCPHISYGTCGITLSSPLQKNNIVDGLCGLYAISGRDKHTCDWVKANTGRDCELVIDSALLNPYFMSDYQGEEKYVLIYAQNVDDNQARMIINLAKRENMKCICVAFRQDWCDEFVHVNSGKDFQKLFAKCSYCFTSTYHGIIFSIIHNKEFWTLDTKKNRDDRRKNIMEILSIAGLEDRLITKAESGINRDRIDYDRVNMRIEEKREKSRRWLLDRLNEIERGAGNGNM